MEKETLTVALLSEGDTLTATLSGEIDHHSAATARETLDRALFKHRPRVLCLDLGGVSFMDSSGLGLVLGRAALCEELGAAVRLLRPSLRVRKIFAVAGLDRIENITLQV
ncbi:MAG: anti-sigma factor antagonist [Clostridia bacterium]|nr:anti-sigma factor antagonist [Clostridia bacterium]